MLIGLRNGIAFELSFQPSELSKFSLKADSSTTDNQPINLSEFINKSSLSPNEITELKNQPALVNLQKNFKTEKKSEALYSKNNYRILLNYPFVPHSDFFNPLLIFDLHPFLPIIALGSLDKSIRLFNFYSKEFVCQKNFENEITAIKYSNDGKLLVVGFLNGNVFVLDSQMTDKNYLENKRRVNKNFINNNQEKANNNNNNYSENDSSSESNLDNLNSKDNEQQDSSLDKNDINFKKNFYNQKVFTNEYLNFASLNLFHIPSLDVLQIISNLSTSVILINFSKSDDFMAISYNNKITFDKDLNSNNNNNLPNLNNDAYNVNFNSNFHGGSIVSLFIFKFSKLDIKHNFDRKNFYNNYNTNLNNSTNNVIVSGLPSKGRGSSPKKANFAAASGKIRENAAAPKEDFYFKISDISIPVSQYESTNMNRNECATTAIDFSDDSMFILMENQVYNKNSNTKKEAIYIVWDIENTQLVIDGGILRKLKFSKFSFSNCIETNDFLNFLNLENKKKKEKLKLIHAKTNKDLDASNNENSEISLSRNITQELNNKNINNKNLKKYNLISNVEDYLYKNIDKSFLDFFKNNNFITSTLPMLNFNFDFEYEFHKSNHTLMNPSLGKNSAEAHNKNNPETNIKTIAYGNSLIKSLANQHIACGSNNGNLHFFRYIYLISDSALNSNANKFKNKKGLKLNYSNTNNSFENSNYIDLSNNERSDFENTKNANKIKFIKSDKIGVSRSFSGHCHKVNLIKSTSDESFLFSSDTNDQIIIEWKIKKENINSDLENFPIEFIADKDPFLETIGKDAFSAHAEDYWLGRLRLTDYFVRYFENNYFNFFFNKIKKNNNALERAENENNNNNLNNNNSIAKNNKKQNFNSKEKQELTSASIDFSLSQVIGRRAYDRRNNLFCDLNNRLIYFTSTHIIFTNLNTLLNLNNINNLNNLNNSGNAELVQNFVIPVENLTQSVQSEISCLALSSDKQEIAVALNGPVSLINVFEINTMMNIGKIFLENFPVVNNLKFSNCKEKIIGSAINRNYYSAVFLLDIKKNRLEATFIFSSFVPFKIKDFEFDYKRNDVFISCGVQHLAIWRMQGNYLVNKNLNIRLENEKLQVTANTGKNANVNKDNFYANRNLKDAGKTNGTNKKFYNNNNLNKRKNKNINQDSNVNEENGSDYENESNNNLSENNNLNINNEESSNVEIIPNNQNNKKYGIFLVNEKEKIEEFINYNFCSRENYKKYYLNKHEEENEANEDSQENSLENEEGAEQEKFYNKTKDFETNSENNTNLINENNTLKNNNTNEIERENIANNFNYNYYFNNFIHVSFLGLKRIKKNFLLAGDDGNVYLMQDYSLKSRISAHYGFITALEINEENKYLLTGGLDGKVNLFNISIDSKGVIRNIYKINTFYTFNYHVKDFSLSEIVGETNFNVQSICTFNQKIIVGTRNGSIMEFDINLLSEENSNNNNNLNNINNKKKNKEEQELEAEEISSIDVSKQNEIANRNFFNLFASKHVLLNFFDDHPPVDIAVDISSKRIFCISLKGFFYVYTKRNLKLVYTFDFKMKTKKICHFKFQNRLLIVFENSLCVLDTTFINRGEKKNLNVNEGYNRLPVFNLSTGLITDLQISSNEKLMAIASVNNSNPQLYM